MGTRADFYKKDKEHGLVWLGSIAFDGYPDGNPENFGITKAMTEDEYLGAVEKCLSELDHSTIPEEGWPWPWDDSKTTDFAYWFDEDHLTVGSCFGGLVFEADKEYYDEEEDEYIDFGIPHPGYPNMKNRQNVRWDKGSGMIVIVG